MGRRMLVVELQRHRANGGSYKDYDAVQWSHPNARDTSQSSGMYTRAAKRTRVLSSRPSVVVVAWFHGTHRSPCGPLLGT
jgi:hypothetical protein